jgi:glycosyltransferase involved in cell wall biosynthesis
MYSQITSEPLVSIGLPAYNGGPFIKQTIESLLSQEYENIELVISDNASTDETQSVCLPYTRIDKRVRYFRNEENLGATFNFKRVFELAKGPYFMWASCHDLWENNFVSSCLELISNHDKMILCCPNADWIDKNNNFLESIPAFPDTRGFYRIERCQLVLWGLKYAYPVYGLFRSDALKKTNLFSNTIGPDIILLFELSFLGEFGFIPSTLFHIRRMDDYGSWDDYLRKSLNRTVDGIERRILFWKMLFTYLSVINRYVPQA